MKVRRFWLSSSVEAHNSASIVLAIPDDLADKDIPFEDLWEEMGVIWGDLEIDGEGPANSKGLRTSRASQTVPLSRDQQGKIVVQQ